MVYTLTHRDASSRHRQIGQSNCDIAANCGKNISVSKRIIVDWLILLLSVWYKLKQLLPSVSLKAVDIYLVGHSTAR